jgi:hypothetical protein
MRTFVPTWRLVVWIVASIGLLALGGIAYTNIAVASAIRGSEERRCASVREEVDFFKVRPPENDRQADSQRYWQDREQEVCGSLRERP